MIVVKKKTEPHVRIFRYVQDIDSKVYNLIEGDFSFQKVPRELFLETIRHPETIKAETLIRGRERAEGRYKFQTGLRKIAPLHFYGDYFEIINEKTKKSFILFCFSSEFIELKIHFFNNFSLYPRSRSKFISNYLKSCK